jgi:hypothetical protein
MARPSATEMIRADHTRVLGVFHRYSVEARPGAKQALAEIACTLLEIHAQIEEEIFYPAMRLVNPALVVSSVPEHDEMRRRMVLVREMDPASEQYDLMFMDLMRLVIHHVADEETTVLPSAEIVLRDRLGELGARMKKRRRELRAPRTGQLVVDTARAVPPATMALAAGALLAGGLFLTRRWRR